MLYPTAYHVTWGTYGARLHGSSKPHVDRDHNQYGEPLAPADPQREHESRDRMKGDPVRLTIEQRKLVALKAVACRALNKRFGSKTWWAEKESAKYLWGRSYFENARDYVRDQRDF